MSADSSNRTAPYISTEPPARRPVPVITVSTPDAECELTRLLTRRLRQVFLIMSVIYAAFLARDLIVNPVRHAQTWILLTAAVGQGVVAVLAWRFRRAGLGWFQAAEVVSLVLFWVSQGVNQYVALVDPTQTALHLGTGDAWRQILIANTWMMPWFAAIAGYPVMVPNSVRRTTAIVGVTAAMPVVIALAAAATNPDLTLTRSWMIYGQFLLWGLIGVGISVYGVAQAAALRKEAFEAKQFGRYRLQTKLGGGGMGEVYLAEHLLLRRPSVIKLIRPDRAADPKMLRRFEREVRLMATLTHWNTVQVFDYGHTPDGTFYYVMEYLPGMNLQELVERHGPLSPGRAVYLLRQVCRGLREAHGVGLIHRDVKPSNVMVCERGGQHDVAKLLDFGLVRGPAEGADAAHLTDEQTVIGTPAYLSPEQACGKPTDARGDVYSLGATAYFLLTGRPPFVKPRAMEVIAAHITEPPRPASECCAGLPDDLCAAVMRCLAKDPADRFPDVRALEMALAACACAADWDEDQAAGWWRTADRPEVNG
jgi:serine/threonine-protein kinase